MLRETLRLVGGQGPGPTSSIAKYAMVTLLRRAWSATLGVTGRTAMLEKSEPAVVQPLGKGWEVSVREGIFDGIDHDEVVLKAIKDGYVNGTMLQNPYGQGFIGSYALDKLRHGCKVKADAPFKTIALTNRFIDSGTVYADKDAVDNYVGSMQAITKKIFTDFASTYLTCP